MKVLDTSFLVDHLNEQPHTIKYLEANAQAKYTIPTITLYEVYTGAIRSTATGKTIKTIIDAITWANVVVFDEPAAREAADIRAALLDHGTLISVPNILNASVARALDYEVIATDDHFAQVPNSISTILETRIPNGPSRDGVFLRFQ